MEHNRKIAVIGLGYVGLPVAVAFGAQAKVLGFDKNMTRLSELENLFDRNSSFSTKELEPAQIQLTNEPDDLKQADFFIITVPTPIDSTKHPDLSPLIQASKTVGSQLKKNDIVVYESTVYPGCTEEVCIPELEQASGLKCGKDFFVGYSPERINPGDKEHTFGNMKKLISATDAKTLNIIEQTYAGVVTGGIYPVSSIKIAEASKVLENTQRDLNISLINEVALIFHKLGIDTQEVLKAASTKWNFLPFTPGLVGGHCIDVDPYYLTHKAQQVGYQPDVILAGRRINDLMGKFIAEETIKLLIKLDTPIKRSKILVMGFGFKENSSDTRNSRVADVIKELKSYDAQVFVHDPLAYADDVKKEYGLDLIEWENIPDVDAIVLAVGHSQYREMDKEKLKKLLHNRGVIMDVRSILDPAEFANTGITLWRL